uniref:Uncharacterized protein n=1 Tax=Triticum urartu TaxID=4572 RepID=A0A8R7K138_TRIUA
MLFCYDHIKNLKEKLKINRGEKEGREQDK